MALQPVVVPKDRSAEEMLQTVIAEQVFTST